MTPERIAAALAEPGLIETVAQEICAKHYGGDVWEGVMEQNPGKISRTAYREYATAALFNPVVCAAIAALIAEAVAEKREEVQGWMPIETAPLDGKRRIDLGGMCGKSWRRVPDCYWHRKAKVWQTAHYDKDGYSRLRAPFMPTHWREAPDKVDAAANIRLARLREDAPASAEKLRRGETALQAGAGADIADDEDVAIDAAAEQRALNKGVMGEPK